MCEKNSIIFDTDSKTKISVMLSENAFYVLRADYYSFEGIKTDNRKKEPDNKRLPGAFLAKVCETHIEGFRRELKERSMAEKNSGDSGTGAARRRKQSDRFPTFQIAMSEDFAFFLNKCSSPELMDHFFPEGAPERGSGSCPPGYFVSAVLEDYAGHNYCEREGIFFSDIIDIVKSASHSCRELRYQYLSKGKINEYSMFPLGVFRDEWSIHNYVLGVTQNGKIISARLSRFYGKPQKLNERDNSEIKEYKAEARNIVGKNGIMFVGGDPIEAVIRMKQSGHEMFNNTSFMRPRHISRVHLDTDDEYCWEYRFCCTKTQLRYYFYKFGDRIIIDEPYDMHREFERNYLKSFLSYWMTDKNAADLCADAGIDSNVFFEKLISICDALHKPEEK